MQKTDIPVINVANVIEEARMGGPQYRIAAVACRMDSKVKTTVFMPGRNSDQFCQKLSECNTPYVLLPLTAITKKISQAFYYTLFSWVEIIVLTVYLRRGRYDVVHVSGGAWQFKGILAGKLSGSRVVWHLNDTSMPWFILILFKMFSRLPNGYISASVRTKEYYRKLIPSIKPVYLVPAPVDTVYLDPDKHTDDIDEYQSMWKGRCVIGTIANVNPVKGLDHYVRLASELNKYEKNLHFVIVGKVTHTQIKLYEKLLQNIGNYGIKNMTFIQDLADVRNILDRIDIYICTSLSESSPMSVWEAMSMSKPVVAHDVGDIPTYIKSGYSGEIVDIGDTAEMLAKVRMLVSDPGLRDMYGQRARRIAVKELDISHCAQRTMEVYMSTINYTYGD